jgi:hypothetical protein
MDEKFIIFVLAMIVLYAWLKTKQRNAVTQFCGTSQTIQNTQMCFCSIQRTPNGPAQGICVLTNSVVGPLKISPLYQPIDQQSVRLSSVPGLPVPVPVGVCTKFLGLSTNPTIALAMIGAPVTRTVIIAGSIYTFSGTTPQVQAQINAQLKESGVNTFQVYVGGAVCGGGVVGTLPNVNDTVV